MPFRKHRLLGMVCWEGLRSSEAMVGFVASLAGMWRNHDDRALRLDRSCLHLKVGYRRPRAEGEDSIPPQKAAMNVMSASGDPLEWNVPELPRFVVLPRRKTLLGFKHVFDRVKHQRHRNLESLSP